MSGMVGAAGSRVLDRLSPARRRSTLDALIKAGALAVAYIAAAQIGFAYALVKGNASPIWPPAGIAVAALLVGGPAIWPGVFLGAVVANLAHGTAPAGAMLLGMAATAEPLAAVELLRRTGFRPQLDRLIDVPLLVLGAGLPALLGASVAMLGLAVGGALTTADAPLAWAAWAAGDALSILVLGGLLLTWSARPASDLLRQRPLEAVVALACVAGTSIVLFFDVFDLRAVGESVAFPLIPLIVWVAFRIGPRGTALAALLFSAIAVAATDRGLGPFVGATREGSLFYVVVFIATTAVTGAAVAAVVAEREANASALESATHEAGDALAKLQALEAIGRRLAQVGPTEGTLDAVIGLLDASFGYTFTSIYTGNDQLVRLGAQRGYASVAVEIARERGVIGRVMRTHEPVHLPDVSSDAAFVRDDPRVNSEISVPLIAQGEFLGVLDVESPRRLDERDLASVTVVADRIAAALALAREREMLASRAAIFQRLVTYSERISAVLAEDELYAVCVDALDAVLPADLVGLAVCDRASGEYVVRAEKGSAGAVGRAIRPGEGPAGCAIRDRTSARIDHYARDAFPAAMHDLNAADVYAQAIGVPLIRDDAVVGSLTVARVDPAMPFTSLELEALAVLADETQLAVSNALLHGEVADLAIHDVLTGLHNRRYFDAALPQVLMSRARMPAESRPPLSAILFDLDYFGDFNMAHGHQIGDEVLRIFGTILHARLRGADLVARYGGEEFIAILPGATRDDAVRIADDVRQRLAGAPVHGVDGRRLSVTVSAGCATVDDAELSGESLVRAADVGLIMAKRSGRNRVVAA